MLRALRRPIRNVLMWQVAATAMMALVAGLVADMSSALSAAAGGAVSIIAGLAAAFVASLSNAKSAGGVLAGALRAEAVKLGLALLLLWLVLANYEQAVVAVLLGAFVVTMLIFSMAFFVREY
ncbi:MAG TPA: ATP synthase subunit I [Burkholderiales bacterium]|jgi:ATP synthase protein I|nr:ATP synthase subunit I [Burkholderiales bacterium]